MEMSETERDSIASVDLRLTEATSVVDVRLTEDDIRLTDASEADFRLTEASEADFRVTEASEADSV